MLGKKVLQGCIQLDPFAVHFTSVQSFAEDDLLWILFIQSNSLSYC